MNDKIRKNTFIYKTIKHPIDRTYCLRNIAFLLIVNIIERLASLKKSIIIKSSLASHRINYGGYHYLINTYIKLLLHFLFYLLFKTPFYLDYVGLNNINI